MSEVLPCDRLQIGSHELTFEPPDLLVARIIGDMSGPEIAELFEEVRRRVDAVGRVFWITDIARLGAVSPEARRIGAVASRIPGLEGVAVFGGGFHQRLAATLAVNAAKLLRPGQVSTPLTFVRDEADARAWVASMREQLDGRPPAVAPKR